MEIPKNVRLFEWLMYSSLAVGFIYAPFSDRFSLAHARHGFVVYLVSVLYIAIYIGFTWVVARRRQGWVRYILLVFFAVMLWGVPNNIRNLPAEPFYNAVALVQIFMLGIAYYFIFTGSAIPWFKRRSPELSA